MWHRRVVSDIGRFHRRGIDESPANRRRSVHVRGATLPSHRHGMGVDAHSAAVKALNGPAIHRRPPMMFNLKKMLHCANDVHWEALVWISTLTLLFHGNLSYFLFILHSYERIYIYIYICIPWRLCMLCSYSIVL